MHPGGERALGGGGVLGVGADHEGGSLLEDRVEDAEQGGVGLDGLAEVVAGGEISLGDEVTA